jgi:hypothetical protein
MSAIAWISTRKGLCQFRDHVHDNFSFARELKDLPASDAVKHFPLSHCHPNPSPSAMLPRNLRSAVVRNALRHQRAAIASPTTTRPVAYPSPFRISPQTCATSSAGFHTSSRRQQEAPKSPFATFVEVLRDELKKNRELQDNVKQLQGDVEKFQDSEAMKKARDAYERARVCSPRHLLAAYGLIGAIAHVEHQREPEAARCS